MATASPQTEVASNEKRRCKPRLFRITYIASSYAWLAIALPSAACAAARRAIGTRYGEHDT
ncbi:hypothetical protein EAS56_30815 [Bradyrhizobium guangzhouense]|uniref:Uncharacterized protein n=1 Tax=Bradyrhizobium guangzhouense TaxID=1325095 RepID=A0AAE5X4F5_9BRAD|nr:hypothetical protein XH91_26310 [Bradyrhizobium guangzhouense]RXH07885.1 hypothetical protein EAS56_30815 [Bradyrhizobium guangzhouense]